MRVLCLDIEGGHGGSSKSLLESLRHMPRDQLSIEVWCRRGGEIEQIYRALQIPCRVLPKIPRASSLPRFSRNLIAFAKYGRDFVSARQCLQELALEVGDRFDLVHFNHEAFFLLARWLRRRTVCPFVMHIRTNLWDSVFARWQTRLISKTMDHLVFITENESTHFRALGGTRAGAVIHNIVRPPQPGTSIDPCVPRDSRLKVACLSTYTWNRGLDRLVDVAAACADRGRRDVLFVMAGDMQLTGSLPAELGAIGRRGGTLEDYARMRGVCDMFLFLGHVSEPERVLVGCDLIAKPTRESNPWGRDILEGMAAGLPVVAVGSWGGFVRHGETGYLTPEFRCDEWVELLLTLADDRNLCRRMGALGRERVLSLCSGPERAADLLRVWQQVAAQRDRAPQREIALRATGAQG